MFCSSSGAVGIFLYSLPGFSTELYFPLFKRLHPNLGLFYIPFVMVVIAVAEQRRQSDRRTGWSGHRAGSLKRSHLPAL